MKMFIKFHKNHTINEEFDFFEVGGGAEVPPGSRGTPIPKFLSQLLLVNI